MSDYPSQPLHSLTAVITGGAKGIGLAIARRLFADGAAIALIGRDAVALEQAAGPLGARHAVADVTDPAALRDAIVSFGRCDILVNNAGAAIRNRSQSTSYATFRPCWRSIFCPRSPPVRPCCQACAPSDFGRIINISSTAGLKGYPYVAAYVASKHALVGLTRALALETIKDGVTVNAICPGFTDTDMVTRAATSIAAVTGRSPENARAALASSNPAGRLVLPEEVAEAVAFLCQRGASAMTGQAIAVACGEV